MRITIAQLNPIVGDISGNLEKIKKTLLNVKDKSSDLVIFSELFLVGYPPRDLLERDWFLKNSMKSIEELKKISLNYPKTGILVGAPIPSKKNIDHGLYNSALLIYNGKILFKQHKSLLPSYDVFDETRYFDPANNINVVPFKNEVLGISICEDAWTDSELWPNKNYKINPQEELAKKKATLFINISSSPFHIGKESIRYRILQNHAKKYSIPLIYVNQVGGNDEIIFDGRSMCFNNMGHPISISPSFSEYVNTIDMSNYQIFEKYKPQGEIESVYFALILGIRDYVRKCNFSKVVVGLSGGIDSAVTVCLANEAVGKENVVGVTMPSIYSSIGSVNDSKKLADNLGIKFLTIPISNIYDSYIKTLSKDLKIADNVDVALENIQARIRGNILMALSNKFGYLVLSAGNKSELAIGYCTLYGDMSGGLAVISDVPKTLVYKLANFVNKDKEVIPFDIINKKPSAELRPDQIDEDTLPPYGILDKILYYYIDLGYSYKDIIKLNFDPKIVEWVINAVNRNEYKRRQAAPVLKVTPKAFGVGRRMPIAAKYDI